MDHRLQVSPPCSMAEPDISLHCDTHVSITLNPHECFAQFPQGVPQSIPPAALFDRRVLQLRFVVPEAGGNNVGKPHLLGMSGAEGKGALRGAQPDVGGVRWYKVVVLVPLQTHACPTQIVLAWQRCRFNPNSLP